jgi:hypothetical protein
MVGTYVQWLPGDPRGWCERNHHQHVPGRRDRPPARTPFAEGRLENSQRIMNWHPYLFEPQDRAIIGCHLLESFQLQQIPILVLAVCEKNFHALLQIHDHVPKRILGIAKRHVTFQFAPIIDSATNKRQQIWEGGALGKPIRDRAHGTQTFTYIMNHIKEGAWAKSPDFPPLLL